MARSYSQNNRNQRSTQRSHRYAQLIDGIDYKDVALLGTFISNYKKILPAKRFSLSRLQQRQLSQAIKRARTMALLPYTNNHK